MNRDFEKATNKLFLVCLNAFKIFFKIFSTKYLDEDLFYVFLYWQRKS